MKNFKVILFDMGRVLVNIDFDAFPNALGLVTKEQREPFTKPAMHLEYLYECGKISTDEFLEKLYHVFHSAYSTSQLLDAYNAIIVSENSTILPFIQEVQKKYRIAVLSNTSEAHWEKSLTIAPLLQLFPQKFTSFQIGAMKPAKIVYEKVIEALAVQPSEILFIDDVKENIEGALSCGMNGIVYTSVEQLSKEFNILSIL